MTRFHGLTTAQEEVLRTIAFGGDGAGQSRKTLEVLEKKGLIVGEDMPTYGPSNAPIDRIPVMVRRYWIPLGTHMEYCQWCSMNTEG